MKKTHKKKKSRRKIGTVQKKIIALCMGGAAFGLCRSPRRQWRILTEEIPAELSRINHQTLEYGLHRLFKNRYVRMRDIGGGKYEPCLTKEGRELALRLSLGDLTIPTPDEWDGYIRIVIFDIPEKFEVRRRQFSDYLRGWGFRSLQKSVMCFPHECGEQVMKAAAACNVIPYVVFFTSDELSSMEHVKQWFDL